jgi:cytochrome c peroxidase
MQSPTLDTKLSGGISLTDQQKEDLKAFLNTLNDEEFVKNTMFQEVK